MKYSIFDLVNESRAAISPTTRETSGAGRQGQALFHVQLIDALHVHLVGFETTTQPSLLSDARMQARKNGCQTQADQRQTGWFEHGSEI